MSQGLACKQCGDYIRGDWGYCEKDGDIFVRTIKERGLASKDVRAERDALRERVQRLELGLREIADDPHCVSPTSGDYGMGVQDGHRCAATKAKAALSIPAGER